VNSLGKWSDTINTFWLGANGCEYIAWKGSHQVLVYPCDDYPNPPSEVWQYHERIETVEQFNDALENSVKYKATYDEVVDYSIDNIADIKLVELLVKSQISK
jgi:hypothetical protein